LLALVVITNARLNVSKSKRKLLDGHLLREV
jgi:hypothetical protein